MRHLPARLLAVLALVLAIAIAPAAGDSPTSTAQAADLSRFDPGNIISDAVFYDAGSMSAGDVQAFLTQKGGNCTAGALCLKNYTVATTNRAGDALCNGYQAGGVESAATIIAKVAVSCGVSPKVLLVLLQKEMGLVTATAPTPKSYERAAGYACPDSANGGCDPAFAGLQNQLYRSAWQYEKYRARPDDYSFVAGKQNTISWSTNPACGTSKVFIVNQATAGLYNYTPYRPNQASLNAGYKASSDPCAQYGNRNFYNYFTDWFGSTGFGVSGAIGGLYVARGGGAGVLGAPAGEMFCGITNGGCAQFFTGGVVYWSAATGAHAVTGPILTHWRAQGWEAGQLGYPTSELICGLKNGGCGQQFTGGIVYTSAATGTHALSGGILASWQAQGWENGALGYPTGAMFCGITNGGCAQFFAGGVIYWSPATGVHPVSGGILASWRAQGYEAGPLGYPTVDMFCGITNGGCAQFFTGGVVYWSPATGVHPVSGGILATWRAQGAEAGPLGYPTTDMACTPGACSQQFAGGALSWTSTGGVVSVSAPVTRAWAALGGAGGALGVPQGEQRCDVPGGGCVQRFTGGQVAWSAATGAHALTGGIGLKWSSLSAELGQPTMGMVCGLRDGGCGQHFQNGAVYWSPASGTAAVTGSILAAWRERGWENGVLGYPTSDRIAVDGSWRQPFQAGAVTWQPGTNAVSVSTR